MKTIFLVFSIIFILHSSYAFLSHEFSKREAKAEPQPWFESFVKNQCNKRVGSNATVEEFCKSKTQTLMDKIHKACRAVMSKICLPIHFNNTEARKKCTASLSEKVCPDRSPVPSISAEEHEKIQARLDHHLGNCSDGVICDIGQGRIDADHPDIANTFPHDKFHKDLDADNEDYYNDTYE